MRKVIVALAAEATLTLAAGYAWKADATMLRSGAVNLPAATKDYSPVEKV